VDDVGESGGRGSCRAVGVPHFLADETRQGSVESVLLHPLKEGVRHLSFFVGQFLHNARVDLGMVPVDEELGGGLVPAVLERVDDYPVVVIVSDPIKHVGGGGVLRDGALSPLGEADAIGGAVDGGGLNGGEVDRSGGSGGSVERDRFRGDPVPSVGVGGGSGSGRRHCVGEWLFVSWLSWMCWFFGLDGFS